MFNKNVPPPKPEPAEPAPQQPVERPKRKEVSPSQQGKFQRALERKEEKKDEPKEVSADKKEKTPEEKEKGLFRLAGDKEHKGKGEGGGDSGMFQQGQQHPSDLSEGPALPEQGEAAVAISGVPVQGEMPTTDQSIASASDKATPEQTGEKGPIIKQDEAITPRQAPMQEPTQVPTEAVARPETTPGLSEAHRAELHALVEQVSQTMATLASKTDTTIVVTLKHPPLFEGASLIVKEATTAKNEFNITFENLSPQARQLIASIANQEQLRQGLIDKGYTLHMVTIEPGVLFVNPSSSEQRPGSDRSFDQGAGGQQQEGEAGTDEQKGQK